MVKGYFIHFYYLWNNDAVTFYVHDAKSDDLDTWK